MYGTAFVNIDTMFQYTLCLKKTSPMFLAITRDMCTKQDQDGENAFSHAFRMHLAITISAMVSGNLGAMSRIDIFLHQA